VVVDDFLDALGDAAEEFFASRMEVSSRLISYRSSSVLACSGCETKQALRHRIGIAEKGKSSEFRDVFMTWDAPRISPI